MTTRLEQFVTDKLLSHLSTRSTSDINPWELATRIGVEVHLYPMPSHLFGTEDVPVIFVDSRLADPEQREELAHELCHFVAHAGNRFHHSDGIISADESQAHRMSMYLLVPTEMLANALDGMVLCDDDEAAAYIASEFNIPVCLAKDRLRLFKSEQRLSPSLGEDYDTMWEHPCSGRRLYFKNGSLAFAR